MALISYKLIQNIIRVYTIGYTSVDDSLCNGIYIYIQGGYRVHIPPDTKFCKQCIIYML